MKCLLKLFTASAILLFGGLDAFGRDDSTEAVAEAIQCLERIQRDLQATGCRDFKTTGFVLNKDCYVFGFGLRYTDKDSNVVTRYILGTSKKAGPPLPDNKIRDDCQEVLQNLKDVNFYSIAPIYNMPQGDK